MYTNHWKIATNYSSNTCCYNAEADNGNGHALVSQSTDSNGISKNAIGRLKLLNKQLLGDWTVYKVEVHK